MISYLLRERSSRRVVADAHHGQAVVQVIRRQLLPGKDVAQYADRFVRPFLRER